MVHTVSKLLIWLDFDFEAPNLRRPRLFYSQIRPKNRKVSIAAYILCTIDRWCYPYSPSRTILAQNILIFSMGPFMKYYHKTFSILFFCGKMAWQPKGQAKNPKFLKLWFRLMRYVTNNKTLTVNCKLYSNITVLRLWLFLDQLIAGSIETAVFSKTFWRCSGTAVLHVSMFCN